MLCCAVCCCCHCNACLTALCQVLCQVESRLTTHGRQDSIRTLLQSTIHGKNKDSMHNRPRHCCRRYALRLNLNCIDCHMLLCCVVLAWQKECPEAV